MSNKFIVERIVASTKLSREYRCMRIKTNKYWISMFDMKRIFVNFVLNKFYLNYSAQCLPKWSPECASPKNLKKK